MGKKFIVDENLYNKSIIKKVINDFSTVAEIKYNEGILMVNWDNEEEIDEIFNEFMNYYIALVNEG